MQHDSRLNMELTDALARLQASFNALAETRDMLGVILTTGLEELLLQINHIDAQLNSGAIGRQPQAHDSDTRTRLTQVAQKCATVLRQRHAQMPNDLNGIPRFEPTYRRS